MVTEMIAVVKVSGLPRELMQCPCALVHVMHDFCLFYLLSSLLLYSFFYLYEEKGERDDNLVGYDM